MTTQRDVAEKVLSSSKDHRELERAATWLARSSDAADLAFLTSALARADFVRRLDAVDDPHFKTRRFGPVLRALGANPAPEVGGHLLTLLGTPEIAQDTARLILLLEAAAAVRPMTDERAEVFRRAPAQPFLLSKMGFLLANGSPLALAELVREVVAKPDEIGGDSVASIMHRELLVRRTTLEIVKAAQDIVLQPVSFEVALGVFESMFDYEYEPWFGPVKIPPQPPPWESASNDAVVELLNLAALSKRFTLPPALSATVDAVVVLLEGILATRGPRDP